MSCERQQLTETVFGGQVEGKAETVEASVLALCTKLFCGTDRIENQQQKTEIQFEFFFTKT
jgi:hypothetical protein